MIGVLSLLNIVKSGRGMKWLAFLGFLGFLGFAKSYQGEPQYVFFAFFAFFSFGFTGRLAGKTRDDRTAHNYRQARQKTLEVLGLLFAALWIFVLLNSSLFHIQYISMKVIEAVVSLVFAFVLVFNSALVWYYERVNH